MLISWWYPRCDLLQDAMIAAAERALSEKADDALAEDLDMLDRMLEGEEEEAAEDDPEDVEWTLKLA